MFGIEFVAGQFVKATLKSAANQLLSDQVAKNGQKACMVCFISDDITNIWAGFVSFHWCFMAHV